MNDLKPFKHGQEGTHRACAEQIKKFGGKTKCCDCTGHKCIGYEMTGATDTTRGIKK